MDTSAINALNPIPRVILDLISGMDPDHPQVNVRFEDVPAGWPMVVQMLHTALGAAIIQAFAQLHQHSIAGDQKRIVTAQGMPQRRL